MPPEFDIHEHSVDIYIYILRTRGLANASYMTLPRLELLSSAEP